MKFFALVALLATVSAAEPALNDPCKAAADCGDATKMCCAVASGGYLCDDDKCTTPSTGTEVPNILTC